MAFEFAIPVWSMNSILEMGSLGQPSGCEGWERTSGVIQGSGRVVGEQQMQTACPSSSSNIILPGSADPAPGDRDWCLKPQMLLLLKSWA